MQPQATPVEVGRPAAPRTQARPRFDVYTGEGREANQAVSPAFAHVVKVFVVIAALFCAVGVARIAIAGATTAVLNANAQVVSTMEAAQDESASLEVMRSVYSSDTRIRDLASNTLGMVDPSGDDGVMTLDISNSAAAGDTQ